VARLVAENGARLAAVFDDLGAVVCPQNAFVCRFGVFELDSRAAELRKNGAKLRLQEQPYQILLKLIEHHGEIVSREELRSTLWHEDTFVDFETGLNTAIKRLRETLGDSADSPTFIETVPRRGYRCIVPVKFLTDASKIVLPLSSTTPFQRREFESSPFQRLFSLFGATPYRRWEILHARMVIWCALLGYLGWRFTADCPVRWGRSLFFIELLCIVLLMFLLSFLIYTGAVNSEGLALELSRTAPWIRWSTIALVLVTCIMAIMIAAAHPVLATFLALFSLAGGFKYTFLKMAFERAAFPKPQ
jgi:DNA-binding winged helix-turn-helix (wHTH) protein